MNSCPSACYKDVALVRSSPTMMGDDIIIICSLVRHLPWPWVGAPHPSPPRLHPALFLLTIPTLLTLQESLMKHRLFLGPLRLPAELLKGIAHKQICMFINILYTPIPQHSPHPHTQRPLPVCSLGYHVHRVGYGNMQHWGVCICNWKSWALNSSTSQKMWHLPHRNTFFFSGLFVLWPRLCFCNSEKTQRRRSSFLRLLHGFIS